MLLSSIELTVNHCPFKKAHTSLEKQIPFESIFIILLFLYFIGDDVEKKEEELTINMIIDQSRRRNKEK